MVEPNNPEPKAGKPARRRKRRLLGACVSLLFLGILAVSGALVAALALGKVNLDMLRPAVVAALQQKLGPNYRLEIGDLQIERQSRGLVLALSDFTLSHPDGRRVLAAPKADISFDLLSLLQGSVKPSRVDIEDLHLTLRVQPDGRLDLNAAEVAASAETEPAAPVSEASSAQPPANAPSVPAVSTGPTPRAKILRQAAAAINSIFDLAAGSESPIALLDHFGIQRGTLVVDDRVARQSRGFEQFAFALDKGRQRSKDVANVAVSAMGPNGRWSVSGSAIGALGEGRRLSFEASGFTIDEIGLIAGNTKLPIDSDIRLSAKAEAEFEADGHVVQAGARLALGDGFWRFDDPDFAPVFIDEVFASSHWDAASHNFILDQAQVFAGATRFFLQGAVSPPARDGAPWTIVLENSEPSQIGPDRAGEKIVTVSRLRAALSLDPPNKLLSLDRIEMVGPEFTGAIQGSIDWSNGPHLRLGVSTGKMTAAAVLALWPNMAGAPVRGWIGDHLLAGNVDYMRAAVDLDDTDLRMMRAQKPPMDDRISIEYAAHDVSLAFLDGAPPLVGATGAGRSTGRSTQINISAAAIETAPGKRLELSEGVFLMPDLLSQPNPMSVGAHLKGGVDVLGDVLSRPGFANYAAMPLDPKALKGQFDGAFTYSTKLTAVPDPSLGRIEASGKVENFSAEHILGKERLEQASLTISVNDGALRVAGVGKIFGAPASIELTRAGAEPAQGSISLTLDEAARARAGINLGASVVGPVAVKATGPIGGARAEGQIELDLTKTALNYPIPGLFKPAGRPAKASFLYREDERGGSTLDQILFDGGGPSARGTAQMASDGNLIQAKFPQLKFSPGDNLAVEATRSGETLKISAHGEALDARPFLKTLAGAHEAGHADSSDFDLELQTTLLSGANRQIISNANVHLSKKGSQYRALAFTGRLGGDSLEGVLSHPDGDDVLRVATADAGALLSFLDLYAHMEGGSLDCALHMADGGFSGPVDIENFALRGEPAMRSFANTAPGDLGRQVKLDPDIVSFSRLHALLQKNGGRLTIRDGAISSPNIGSTLEGWIDFDRDALDLSGVFVPAYGVNNLFGKVPVLGQILGGGDQEGLIGLNFRVTGKASGPVLAVNPLSAIAPGFLRKIFGVAPFNGDGLR